MSKFWAYRNTYNEIYYVVSCCFWQRKKIRPWEILRAFHPKWNASAKSQLLVQCALSAHRVENSLTYQNPVRGLRKLSKQRHQVYQEYRHKTQKLWIWRWFQWLDGKSVRKFSAKASRWIPRSPSTDHKDRKNMELHFMILMNLALFWGKVGVGVHHGYRPDVRVARRIHCTDLEVVLHRPKETSYQNRVAMPHKSVKIPKRSQNVNKSWNCGSRMLQRLELWCNIDHSLSSINQDLFINFIPLSIGTVLISSGYVAHMFSCSELSHRCHRHDLPFGEGIHIKIVQKRDRFSSWLPQYLKFQKCSPCMPKFRPFTSCTQLTVLHIAMMCVESVVLFASSFSLQIYSNLVKAVSLVRHLETCK